MDYRAAGVDVEAGQNFVRQIRQMVESTHRPEVLGGLGGFSGLFQLATNYKEPVLVSGTDGVGTKLKIAQALNQHDTIGVDLVAMCVNDVLTCGAEPLFFLDYLATGKLEPAQLTQVVAGVAAGCQQAGCALLGGETAEMPGFYQPGEYDLAGFCVGVVEKQAILSGDRVEIGDIAIGLASQGVHSNGYSLVRKVMSEGIPPGQTEPGYAWSDRPQQLQGKSLGEVLLAPTRLYVKPVLQVRQQGLPIHSMAHITGGGLPENLPRCLGPHQSVQLSLGSWPVPPIFDWLAIAGDISPAAMFNTFNMGIGFVVLVAPSQAQAAIQGFEQAGVAAYQIGQVVEGSGEVLGLPQLED
ncbi:phosphoribosylformylglycinamidine cyclo-ligase [Sphaerothrix gracilis]|uniref:phosphoribosylformylglycinamidine cyclo-ligase n=1 Tax=Sphaerothrix gracilis TaxID=3151835 RepID=UPI0031FDE2AA